MMPCGMAREVNYRHKFLLLLRVAPQSSLELGISFGGEYEAICIGIMASKLYYSCQFGKRRLVLGPSFRDDKPLPGVMGNAASRREGMITVFVIQSSCRAVYPQATAMVSTSSMLESLFAKWQYCLQWIEGFWLCTPVCSMFQYQLNPPKCSYSTYSLDLGLADLLHRAYPRTQG